MLHSVHMANAFGPYVHTALGLKRRLLAFCHRHELVGA